MKERAASFNGEVHVVGQAGVGTTVRVRMPLSDSSL
jgi:signal transduction histidine kinase